MGAGISGGGTRGPHKPGRRSQGGARASRACGPLVQSPDYLFVLVFFSKILEKIILDFHNVRRTFIFGVLFYRMLKQKTGKTKLNLSFFF